jgi:hypothetical protein
MNMPTIRRHTPWVWDGAAIVALAAVCVGLWGDCLWGGKTPVAAVYQQQMRPWAAQAANSQPPRQWDSLLFDSVAQFYPWRLLTHRAAQTGELPLWNPYQFSGTPFVGNGQSALFYPPNWLYIAIHPRLGLGLSAALHTLLGALFAFGLGRCLGLLRPAAMLAALAFVAGGFVITWMELPTLVNSLIWLPLAWCGIEVALRGRPVRGAVMLALALGMTLLAGHLQIAAYVWLFALGYAAVALVARARRHSGGATGRWLVLAVVLGGLLSLAQVLPTLELGGRSTRGVGRPSAEGFAFHQQRTLRPVELLTLLDPDFLGSPVTGDYPGISYSEHCGFVGAVTLLCGLGGLAVGWRRKRLWLLAGIALFALGGALGGLPAWLMYWGVPKLGQAGGFARLLSVWTLAAALWGGMGLDALLRAVSARAGKPAASGGQRSNHSVVWVLAGLVLGLWAVQVLPWAYQFNPRSPAAEVYPETPLIADLRARVGSGRVMAVTPRREWGLQETPVEAVLPPNSGTAYGIRFIEGYDSLFPADYRAFVAGIEGADPSPAANGNMLLLEKAAAWAPRVACVVAAEGQLLGMGSPVATLDGCEVFAGAESGAHRAVIVAPGEADSQGRPAAIVGESCNRVAIEVSGQAKGTLVLRDSPYPGWQVAVDGQLRTEQLQAGPGERRLPLQSGDRRVEMVYHPPLVIIGGFASLLGWVWVMLLVGQSLPRRLAARRAAGAGGEGND